jgi:hypothetical protein
MMNHTAAAAAAAAAAATAAATGPYSVTVSNAPLLQLLQHTNTHYTTALHWTAQCLDWH